VKTLAAVTNGIAFVVAGTQLHACIERKQMQSRVARKWGKQVFYVLTGDMREPPGDATPMQRNSIPFVLNSDSLRKLYGLQQFSSSDQRQCIRGW